MKPRFEVGLRRTPRGGWRWEIIAIERARMHAIARGQAPFRWMAALDARHFLRRRRVDIALQLLGV